MATEYRLPFTAKEIEEKLNKIDNYCTEIEVDEKLENKKPKDLVANITVKGNWEYTCDVSFVDLWNAYENGRDVIINLPNATIYGLRAYFNKDKPISSTEKIDCINFGYTISNLVYEFTMKSDESISMTYTTLITNDKIKIKQETGTSESYLMSQRAITDAIELKANEVTEYVDVAIIEKQDKNFIITLISTTAEDGTTTYSVDKTFEEIAEAYNKGANLYLTGISAVTYMPLYKSYYPSNFRFAYYEGMSMQYYQIVINSNNTVNYTSGIRYASKGMYGGVRAEGVTETDTVEAKIGSDGKLYVPAYPITDTEISAESENPVQNKVIKEYVDNKVNSTKIHVQDAEVGQMLIVKEVDESGKPTKWECVDRTHYEEKVELLAETTAIFDISMDFGYPMNECLDLKVGEECTIKWNDKEYTCVAKEYEVEGTVIGVAVGNVSFMEGQTSTGEPFCIMSIYPECSAILGGFGSAVFDIEGYMADEEGQEYSATNTFSIKKTSVKKLDNKFLDLKWLPTLIPKEEKIYENTISFGNSRTETFSPRPFELVSGKTYIVEWNGERYECVCRSVTVSGNVDGAPDGSGIYVIGNTTLDLITDDYFSPRDKDKPFLYMYSVKEGNVFDLDCTCGFASNAINVDIPVKVYGVDYVPNIIPKEFLPEHSWNTLEDRPFYSEGGGEAVELVNETVEYTDDGYIVTTPLELVVGDTYTVSYGDTEHECVCWSYSTDGMTGLILGNGEVFTGNNTGEPFCLLQLVDMGVTLFAPFNTEVTEPIHLVISGVPKEVVHKLPNKYLDMEWIPKKKEVLLLDEIIVKQTSSFGGSVIIIDDTFFNNFIDSNGKKVIVCLDGERYETTIKVLNESGFIEDAVIFAGNASIYGSGMPNTGEPFVIQFGGSFTELVTKEAGEHTISVYELEPNPMSEEFLPEHTHSWNDLDDRPFGEEIKEIDLIEEQTIVIDDRNSIQLIQNDSTQKLYEYEGQEYIVVFDGISYSGTVYKDSDECYHTDFITESGVEVWIFDCSYCSIVNRDDLIGEHTIRIYVTEKIIHKLPEEFLPDLATGGTLFVNVTEDDDGNFLSDKTHAEIVESHESGKVVQVLYDGFILPLIDINSSACAFSLTSDGSCIWISINSGGGVYIEEYSYFDELFYGNANFAEIDELNTTNKTLVGAINEVNENKIQKPSIAEVGQIIAVKAVDENGKPTEFEAVEMPSCGSSEKTWRKIAEIEVAEDVRNIEINTDIDGNPFEIDEVIMYAHTVKTGIKCPVNIRMLNKNGDWLFTHNLSDCFDTSNGQHVRSHTYHNGLRYITDFINNYSISVALNVRRVPASIEIKDKDIITSIVLLSPHSNASFHIGTTIEIWGVDA